MGYIEEFPLAGRRVKVALRDLPGDHEFILDNYLSDSAMAQGNYQPGSAKVATIVSAVQRLEIDGIEVPLTSSRKRIPRIYDRDQNKSLMTAVLERIVKREEWLLEQPYSRVFAEYADDDLTDEFTRTFGDDTSIAEQGLENPTERPGPKKVE